MYDAMYDYDILTQAWKKYCHDFTPDAYNAPTTIVPGKLLDILDFKLCKWPGRGVSKQQEYQYEDSPRHPLMSSAIPSGAPLA
jgi:hypothetical protein